MSVNDAVIDHNEQATSQQRINGSLDPLLRVGHDLGSNLDLTAVLRQVLSTTVRSVNAGGGSILVLDEGGWPSHGFILDDGQEEFVTLAYARAIREQALVNWVIQHRQGDVVEDLTDDPRWLHLPDLPISAEHRAALCLPLLVYDRLVGVLTLVHRTPGFFTPHHLNLLDSIADRIALSIESARLYETVRLRAEEMAALYDVALNISADQPLDRLLETIVAQAMDLLHCQGGGLFLWREEENELELVAAYDPEIDLRGMRVAPGEGLAGRVFETGDPLALGEHEDWSNWPAYGTTSDLAPGLPTAAATAVPLVWQGQPIGVLMTTDRTPGRHFDHSDRHLLTLLAHQAAAAITSVQLHEQTLRRLQELVFFNETTQDITATLNLDEIFAILTRRVKDLLAIEACSIALVDRETDELVFQAASGGGAETVLGERVAWGQGIVGAAAQSRKPVNVFDVRQDDRFYREVDKKQTDFVTHSILAVPMISRGQVVGVVEALNKPGGFDSENERLLSALANLAASVVENANLFNSVRAAEIRYQALFEDAADAAWVTDTTGTIIQANRKAATLTGRDGETMPGLVLWDLTAPQDSETWRTALAQALEGEEPTVESWIVAAEGIPCPLELRLKRIQADEGTRVQWIGRDISSRRELEQLRENLTHMIVHDLRSPVGTIANSLTLLGNLTEGEKSDQTAQLLDIASRATQRLSNLVNSLLDISLLEAGQELTNLQPNSIQALIESAVNQLTLYAQRKRARVTVKLSEPLPVLLADGGMIERVLVNLIDNALKFTPADSEVSISAEVDQDLLWVRVQDDGPGIPPQYQRRIFDKFARVRDRKAVRGIGLGLAFCRLAIEAHNGRIWVESPPGQGATFVFTLPAGWPRTESGAVPAG